MTSLPNSARALHKYVQNLRILPLRQSSSDTSGTTGNPVKSELKHSSNSSHIRPVFYNRNPRNLEMMTIASKPEGYHLDRTNVQFWHKLVVTPGHGKITAEVIHNNGTSVVSASSSEFGIKRLLYRYTDVAAYKTVGKVIAQRCIESGINAVYCDIEAEEDTKLALLLEEAMKGGLALEEGEAYKRPFVHSRKIPTKPWDIVS